MQRYLNRLTASGLNAMKLAVRRTASRTPSFFQARVGGDVYLIGTTNVGKSSIFNLLLESDLCSIKAIDKVS